MWRFVQELFERAIEKEIWNDPAVSKGETTGKFLEKKTTDFTVKSIDWQSFLDRRTREREYLWLEINTLISIHRRHWSRIPRSIQKNEIVH